MIDEYFNGCKTDLLTILDYIIIKNDYVSGKQLADKFGFHPKTGRRYIQRIHAVIRDLSFINGDVEDGCIRIWVRK